MGARRRHHRGAAARRRGPWWPEERVEVTLHRVLVHMILVHMIAETHRHAGHTDVVRELIDGRAGLRPDSDNMAPGDDNMAPGDESWWTAYRQRLETAAAAPAASGPPQRGPRV